MPQSVFVLRYSTCRKCECTHKSHRFPLRPVSHPEPSALPVRTESHQRGERYVATSTACAWLSSSCPFSQPHHGDLGINGTKSTYNNSLTIKLFHAPSKKTKKKKFVAIHCKIQSCVFTVQWNEGSEAFVLLLKFFWFLIIVFAPTAYALSLFTVPGANSAE